jgi:hypothetical protein
LDACAGRKVIKAGRRKLSRKKSGKALLPSAKLLAHMWSALDCAPAIYRMSLKVRQFLASSLVRPQLAKI